MTAWKNWSGSVAATPERLARPTSEAELSRLVAEARRVRVVGAGHSFTPLCATDGALVSLEAIAGEPLADPGASRVWVPAGMRLSALTRALWDQGLSLANQGDIDVQTLAGALATGTHGTGLSLGSLSTQATGFRMLLADGQIVTCDAREYPDLFEAQRLSLGLLGVALDVELAVTPAYHLHERVVATPLDAVEEQWPELIAAHRHVEFFVFPHAKRSGPLAILKTLDPVPAGLDSTEGKDVDDAAFARVCDWCARAPFLTRFIQPHLIGPKLKSERRGPAFRVFPSAREVRFEEMEYEVPLDQGFAALRAAIERVVKRGLPVAFPFEFRVTAGDDIWLSPFNQGPCASISMHQFHKMDWRTPFSAVEPVLRAHGGRPHWGKRHGLKARDVETLYPMVGRFKAVRDQVDPDAKFVNAHLAALFDIADPQAAAVREELSA